MGRLLLRIVSGMLFCILVGTVSAQTVRMANGVIIKGEAKAATANGLVVATPKGEKTYAWETLSPSTRYRYESIYRANYEAVLAGLPPSSRMNEPNEKLLEEPEKPDDDDPEDQSEPAASLRLEDQVAYENIAPFRVEDFPLLDLSTPETTAFWALQYGPRSKDILYFAFDSKKPGDIRDAMFIYGPNTEDYQSTVRQKGLKKRVGEQYTCRFKSVGAQSRFNEISAAYQVSFTYATGRARDLDVLIDVQLSARDRKSRFLLFGQPTDLVYREGEINVRGIIDLPVMWVGLDPASESPRLVGDLRMSSMKLCPKRGMDNVVNITILDEGSSQTVDELGVKIDESSLEGDYTIICDLPKLAQGATYQVRASIDLGPFLGVVSYNDKITIPK